MSRPSATVPTRPTTPGLPRARAWVTVTALALLLSGCGGTTPSATDDASSSRTSETPSPTPSPNETSAPDSSSAAPRSRAPEVIGTVAGGLAVPWGVAFLPDGSALVTERDSGRVLQLKPGADGADAKVSTVGRIEEAQPSGEAGLLGVAVSPDFERDHRVFFYVTAQEDNQVLRTTFEKGRLGTLRPILRGIPKAVNHDGGRMVFGPDGMLFVSTGEAGQPPLAQEPNSLGGKILRIDQDGNAPKGNPTPGSPLWTTGHRNVQGLAFDEDGNLWASEFGAQTYDELNLIERGRNYGWPIFEGKGDDAAFADPQVQWATDDASPSGLAFLDGRLWLGALRGERLWRVDVTGTKAGGEKGFFVGDYGRLRTVVAAPDGNLWVTTSNRDGRGDPASNDDRILLVRP